MIYFQLRIWEENLNLTISFSISEKIFMNGVYSQFVTVWYFVTHYLIYLVWKESILNNNTYLVGVENKDWPQLHYLFRNISIFRNSLHRLFWSCDYQWALSIQNITQKKKKKERELNKLKILLAQFLNEITGILQ